MLKSLKLSSCSLPTQLWSVSYPMPSIHFDMIPVRMVEISQAFHDPLLCTPAFTFNLVIRTQQRDTVTGFPLHLARESCTNSIGYTPFLLGGA